MRRRYVVFLFGVRSYGKFDEPEKKNNEPVTRD